MANTNIRIKRSLSTGVPSSLLAGELAYSYQSNTIFIGSPDGNGVVNVGGQYYTSQIDNATDTNIGDTLVRRDASGNASFNYISANVVGSIIGNANSASQLLNPRDFSISGGDISANAVSFDGTNNVVLNASLNAVTGLTAGVYGGTTAIPVIDVAANGRIMAISNTVIATSFDISGNTGTDTFNGGETLSFIGNGSGIVTTVSNGQVVFATDTTLVRSNTAIGKQTIDGDIELSGNLIVLGTTTSVNVSTLSVDDSLIALAKNNVTDAVDIGFYGHYNDGTNRHAGIYRHAGDKQFYVFDNYDQEPVANTINPSDPSFRLATLHTNLTGNTANLVTVVAGTVFVDNRIYGDTGNNTIELVPSTSYGSGGNHQYIIIDPTTPNHIHLRAGGAIDSSDAELFLGGENAGVQVSDSTDTTYVRANSHTWTFADNASLTLPGGLFASNIPNATTGNLVYFDTANGRFSYASDNSLTPTSIANGSYSLSIQSSDGLLVHNGDGIQLKNGAVIKDTSGDAVAFGQNAGTTGQGAQAVAIGDSAGYNNQGAYGVAIGYGAGNVSQGQVAIAIGLNAGISNQGYNGIAIGGSAGSGQGQYAIAMGYDTGGQQGNFSIAIGNQAGKGNTSAIGVNSIAIGNKAGFETAAANSIILNASGLNLSSAVSGLFVDPVRYTNVQDSTYDGLVFYNASTKEVRYSYALDGGSF
jgi:hypothetical protein